MRTVRSSSRPGGSSTSPPRDQAPPLWTEWQTSAKILPCPKFRLRAVNITRTKRCASKCRYLFIPTAVFALRYAWRGYAVTGIIVKLMMIPFCSKMRHSHCVKKSLIWPWKTFGSSYNYQMDANEVANGKQLLIFVEFFFTLLSIIFLQRNLLVVTEFITIQCHTDLKYKGT